MLADANISSLGYLWTHQIEGFSEVYKTVTKRSNHDHVI